MKNINSNVGEATFRGKVSRLLAGLASALVAVLLSGCAGTVKDTSRSFTGVVIDAGHGGHDSGATSRYSGREKDAALEVALRLRSKLESAGFRAVMTRSNDTFIPLDTRARISNRQDNVVFVSIHFNDSPRRRVHGAEAYYNSRCSVPIAQNILNQVCAVSGTAWRGVRRANFRVLARNEFPAVLVECGYLSNPREGRRCASSGFREQVSVGIARGLMVQRYGGIAMVAAQ